MKNSFWRFIYKLHRYIGLLSAIVLIMLAVTGIALNHTDDLQLDRQMIQSSSIIDWYGIKPPENPISFPTQNHWLTQLKQKIYFDQVFVIEKQESLLGAIETNQFIVAAFDHSLLLLSHTGELIEQMPFDSIESIGLNQQQAVIIKTTKTYSISDDGLLSWQAYKPEQVIWSSTKIPPKNILKVVQHNFLGSILPMERVLLDIHSGRFFGRAGVIIVDISGIFLIILAFSGCTIWLKHKFRSLHHPLRSFKKRQ